MNDSLDAAAAVEKIEETILQKVENTEGLDLPLKFYIEKLVKKAMDFCHIDWLPLSVAYDIAEILIKQIMRKISGGGDAPLKSISENDVKFEFAAENVDVMADAAFERMKPTLQSFMRMLAY